MTKRLKQKSKGSRSAARSRPPWERAVIVEYARLRSFPGVLSVSIGLKELKRAVTGRLSVKIYVAEKLAKPPAGHTLPKSTTVLFPVKAGIYQARRVPTDVVEVRGIKLAADPTARLDPALVGAQIGFPQGAGGAGTLGCWVNKPGINQACFLTAGHVISVVDGEVASGQSVYQPQPPFPSPQFDGLIIGQTTEGFVGNAIGADGYLDYVAITLPTDGRGGSNSAVDPSMPALGPHLTLQTIRAQQISVRKCGERTGCTDGLFSAFHEHFVDPGGKTFNNILEFTTSVSRLGIGDSGDSGSVVVSTSARTEGAVVGLLFAVSLDLTRGYVVPFERLASLGFRVAS